MPVLGVMIETGERFCQGVVEMSTFNFLTCKSIFHVSETMNLNIFRNPGGIYWFEKIKFVERERPNGLYRNIRRPVLEARYEN